MKKKDLNSCEQCQKCGRTYIDSWTVPDYIRKEVIGAEDENMLLCMDCFSQMAEEKGMTITWFGVRKFPDGIR